MTDLTAMRAAFQSDPALEGFDKTLAAGELAQYQHYESLATEATWHGFKAGAAWNAKSAAQVSEAVAVYLFRQIGAYDWIETDEHNETRMKSGPAALCFEYRTLYTRPATEQVNVPTWQERHEANPSINIHDHKLDEIADLRAALAKRGQP
jgi:hypothetical protein